MVEDLKMNTAVSQIMIFTNYLRELDQIPKEVWKGFIKVIAPFMPFLAEELWQDVNKSIFWSRRKSVHFQEWPSFDEVLATEEIIELPVQINGKNRVVVEVDVNASEDEVKTLVESNERVQEYIEGKDIKKVIYVPQKIINYVI